MADTIFDNIDPVIMERIKNLRLIDDELMTIVFNGDKEATELLIRILLNRNDLKVTKSMTQEQKHNLFGRSIKLDIVAEDIFKTEYNIEIQRADKGAGAKRIRYHQAMIDSHTLKKQEAFETLPNLYIIFILEHDMFGRNEPIYSVSKTLNIKDEDGNNLISLGKLMHDFSTPNADEMIYNSLADKVYNRANSKKLLKMQRPYLQMESIQQKKFLICYTYLLNHSQFLNNYIRKR